MAPGNPIDLQPAISQVFGGKTPGEKQDERADDEVSRLAEEAKEQKEALHSDETPEAPEAPIEPPPETPTSSPPGPRNIPVDRNVEPTFEEGEGGETGGMSSLLRSLLRHILV